MYKVGEFVFDYDRSELIKNDATTKIEPQVNELLHLFVNHAQNLVSKKTILETLWPDRVVSDDAFRAVIKKLRKSLGDNARDPDYIRTVPLKGFVFLADVTFLSSKQTKTQPFNFKPFLVAFFVLLLAASSTTYLMMIKDGPVVITKLTNIDGSEVIPSYHSKLQQLVFSHRTNKDDFLQLYTQSLVTGKVKRLTYEDANFGNGSLSPKGDKIAFTRSTPNSAQTFIADFSQEQGMTKVVAIPNEVANQRYLQTWNSDGSGLYLSDFKTPNQSQGIWFYHLHKQTLISITSSNPTGSGDYFARESSNGQFLAILRNIGSNNNELLIQHLQSGELAHVYKLPRTYTHLIWSDNDNTLTLSSFYAEYAKYTLSSKTFEELSLDLANTNNIFASCAQRCFFARQHTGNYLDLTQQPNPFKPQSAIFHDYSQFEGAEDLPVLGQHTGNIYFINKVHQRSQLAVMQNNEMKVLASLPVHKQFEALQINTDESYLAGIMNNRLFLYDLHSENLRFITTELEKVESLQWSASGQSIQYARIEHGEPVLYRYELTSNTKIRETTARFSQLSINDELTFVIDQQRNAWIYPDNDEPLFLANLPSVSPNRWQLNGDWLYYPIREENLTFMIRVNITTGETQQHLLAKNRFRINFDMSKDGTNMLTVRSVLAQSDLVKVEY